MIHAVVVVLFEQLLVFEWVVSIFRVDELAVKVLPAIWNKYLEHAVIVYLFCLLGLRYVADEIILVVLDLLEIVILIDPVFGSMLFQHCSIA